jgi:hypothetical protein
MAEDNDTPSNAPSNVTPLRLAPAPPRDDGFDEIHARLYEEIDELRCVVEILSCHASFENLGDTALAARSVLTRSLKRLDDVHTDFWNWHMRLRRETGEAP